MFEDMKTLLGGGGERGEVGKGEKGRKGEGARKVGRGLER